jgi:hypothetical protein
LLATYSILTACIMEQFVDHLGTFLSAALSLHAFALLICNLTKTPKDDEFVAKAYKVIEVFAGIITPRAKK